ncbi:MULTISPECIES: hypothetical protein [unclassified Nocardia]|uniref:hypothetical protein n=1 Tax=unclassified Nocardia TaxID=2637762 RepID=UPI001CE48E2A|nr:MULTISPECIES: hypothetical protein [unclassified Nocardia]
MQAVHDEGAGRITRDAPKRYLNWSHDVGYWLDDEPKSASGARLRPFASSAADEVARGSHVRLESCGVDDGGSAPAADICAKFTAPEWVIDDEFTPGLGGKNHIDLYIGEEDTADFPAKSPMVVTWTGATVRITPPGN